ncbi:hypothetical protein D3C81_2295600 [compost metagenome]
MLATVGRKRHAPCALPSNSMVMVRLLSTWVLATSSTVASFGVRILIPVISQIFLYIGISA